MTRNNSVENVLILQGGGSLGAFGCGVFKAIAESQVKIDILAGTSIGGINAGVIAGSRVKRLNLHLNNSGSSLQKTQLILRHH
jgi:predicted acylesterase/phospholipase RssA